MDDTLKADTDSIHGVPDTGYYIIKCPLATSTLEKWNVQHL